LELAVKYGKYDKFGCCEAYIALGDWYLIQKVHSEAKNYFHKAFELAEVHNFNIEITLDALSKLIRCCKMTGDSKYKDYTDYYFELQEKSQSGGDFIMNTQINKKYSQPDPPEG
jgi:hypothetical protein